VMLGPERMVQLAERCLAEIAEQLMAANAWRKDVSVLLALPEPRPGFGPQDAVEVQQSLASRPILATRSIRVERAGEGHAGAISALRMAVERVSAGQQELVIVGGVDTYLDARTIEWLDGDRRLARTDIPSGLPPGEGAALMAVVTDTTCNRLGLQSLARIRGVGCAYERRDPMSDLGLLGEGLAEAVLGATKDLSLPRELITDTYGDINGERGRNEDWGFALMRTSTCFRDGTDYVCSAGQCGDVGAATGALGCVLATEAWRFDCAHGPRALVWAGSWGGLRGAVVLEHQAA
jgi:3-oxoacyl-[acyl-carrier-protein] synthase I